MQKKGTLRAITVEYNGAYQAGPDWNPCTGFETPDGTKLRKAAAAKKS